MRERKNKKCISKSKNEERNALLLCNGCGLTKEFSTKIKRIKEFEKHNGT